MSQRVLGTLIVLFVLVLLLFSLGHAGMAMGGGWAWLLLVLALVSFFLLMGGMCEHGGHGHGGASHAPQTPCPPNVDTTDIFAPESDRRVGAATVRGGRLLASANDAMARLRERFRGTGWTPLLTPAEDGAPSLASLPVAPDQAEQIGQRYWLHAALFLATLATTTNVGRSAPPGYQPASGARAIRRGPPVFARAHAHSRGV